MSDPLSVTASIAAILQISFAVAGYFGKLAQSTKEHQQILKEIQSCDSLLEDIKKVLKLELEPRTDNDGKPDAQLEVPKILIESLVELKDDLSSMKDKFKKEKKRSLWTWGLRKAAWPMKAEEATQILARMETRKANLIVALQLLQM